MTCHRMSRGCLKSGRVVIKLAAGEFLLERYLGLSVSRPFVGVLYQILVPSVDGILSNSIYFLVKFQWSQQISSLFTKAKTWYLPRTQRSLRLES